MIVVHFIYDRNAEKWQTDVTEKQHGSKRKNRPNHTAQAWRKPREGGREEGVLVKQDEKSLRQKTFFLTGNDFFTTHSGSQEPLTLFRR